MSRLQVTEKSRKSDEVTTPFGFPAHLTPILVSRTDICRIIDHEPLDQQNSNSCFLHREISVKLKGETAQSVNPGVQWDAGLSRSATGCNGLHGIAMDCISSGILFVKCFRDTNGFYALLVPFAKFSRKVIK